MGRRRFLLFVTKSATSIVPGEKGKERERENEKQAVISFSRSHFLFVFVPLLLSFHLRSYFPILDILTACTQSFPLDVS